MQSLVHEARVHVFYTPQPTGIKLKLLHALQTSGHIIVNHKMIEGTDLLDVCHLALLMRISGT